MGLGVLDPRDPDVPGTVHVLDNATATTEIKATDRALKRDGNIILVPQPSDDPNDPLVSSSNATTRVRPCGGLNMLQNWPRWKRDLVLFILCLISIIATALSPLLAANTVTLTLWYNSVRDVGEALSFTQAALLTGYHLLGVGAAGFIFVASARVWGKRHLYLLGTVLVIVGSAWGGATGHNYGSMVAARVIQGVGLAPFEALVNASVGDLYFVHERGIRMAASNMAVFGGAFFTPIVVGKITESLGWWWSFYFIAIFAAALLPLVVLYVPETAFRRPDYLNTDLSGDGSPGPGRTTTSSDTENGTLHVRPESSRELRSDVGITHEKPSTAPDVAQHDTLSSAAKNGPSSPADGPPPVKASFARTLLPFNGRKTDDNFLKLLLRPLPLFLHPAILWACLIQGALIGWTVLIGVMLAVIFIGPPLYLGEVTTGYFYAGPFLGAFVGFLFAGAFTDLVTRAMIRRNGGVYEPEFRIVLVLPQLVAGAVGLYGFGWAAVTVQPGGWFLPAFFFALEVAGMVIGAVASALYIVDAYRDLSVEAFTCMLIFKNIFSFGLTFSAYDWILQSGNYQALFNIVASVQISLENGLDS